MSMPEPFIDRLNPGERTAAFALVQTTMGELGDHLPHGILTPTGRDTSFEFLPPTLGTEKRLGALGTRKDLGDKPFRHAAFYLGQALRSLCGQDLTGMKPEEAALAVARLPVADVLYLVFARQALARDGVLQVSVPGCTACPAEYDSVNVQLSTVEVTRLPDEATRDNPPVVRLGLTRGFPFPAGKKVSTVLLKPPAWVDSLWPLTAGAANNSSVVNAALMGAAICGVDTCGLRQIPAQALDEIWPVDFEAINEALAEITPTPDLTVRFACPACGAEQSATLDWARADFFGRSSKR